MYRPANDISVSCDTGSVKTLKCDIETAPIPSGILIKSLDGSDTAMGLTLVNFYFLYSERFIFLPELLWLHVFFDPNRWKWTKLQAMSVR